MALATEKGNLRETRLLGSKRSPHPKRNGGLKGSLGVVMATFNIVVVFIWSLLLVYFGVKVSRNVCLLGDSGVASMAYRGNTGNEPDQVELSPHFGYGYTKNNHRQLTLKGAEGQRTAPSFQLRDIPDYVEVHENRIPTLHQEGGFCKVGHLIWMIGGLVTPAGGDVSKNLNGSAIVSIYDLETMNTTAGPTFPEEVNHVGCALSPDGLIHVTGGYGWATNGKQKKQLTFDRHWVLNTSAPVGAASWEKRTNMPSALGAHGCTFANDGKMYCVGGGKKQGGPFTNDLNIYDPGSDTWSQGPPMQFPRDHLMQSVQPVDGGQRIYVVGGRSQTSSKLSHPSSWTSLGPGEVYDLNTKAWMMVQSPQFTKNAIASANLNYPQKKSPNVLLVGGQIYQAYSGFAVNTVEEYDTEKDVYYCRESLPFPTAGGVIAVHKGKLHVLGGAEWQFFAASPRLQVYDLTKAPPAKPCFFHQVPVFGPWVPTDKKDIPYPEVEENNSRLAKEFLKSRQDRINRHFRQSPVPTARVIRRPHLIAARKQQIIEAYHERQRQLNLTGEVDDEEEEEEYQDDDSVQFETNDTMKSE